MSYPAWSIKMALFIFRTVSSFIFFIFWTVPSYSVIPLTTLMVISKLDIAVYFHITPVGFYIIRRWFTYLIGRKSASKTYPSAFQEIRCSPWWFGQVSPGCRNRGPVKLYQNHCLAKMDSLLTLNSHSNFFGWKMLLSSDIKIPLCVKLANSRPFNVFSGKRKKYLNVYICKNSCKHTLTVLSDAALLFLQNTGWRYWLCHFSKNIIALLQIVNLDGVNQRKRNRLIRQNYIAKVS